MMITFVRGKVLFHKLSKGARVLLSYVALSHLFLPYYFFKPCRLAHPGIQDNARLSSLYLRQYINLSSSSINHHYFPFQTNIFTSCITFFTHFFGQANKKYLLFKALPNNTSRHDIDTTNKPRPGRVSG